MSDKEKIEMLERILKGYLEHIVLCESCSYLPVLTLNESDNEILEKYLEEALR